MKIKSIKFLNIFLCRKKNDIDSEFAFFPSSSSQNMFEMKQKKQQNCHSLICELLVWRLLILGSVFAALSLCRDICAYFFSTMTSELSNVRHRLPLIQILYSSQSGRINYQFHFFYCFRFDKGTHTHFN